MGKQIGMRYIRIFRFKRPILFRSAVVFHSTFEARIRESVELGSIIGRGCPLIHLRAPFFLSFFPIQRVSPACRKSWHVGARSDTDRFKALPLATDKIAEDPPDPLSKKLAKNSDRSAQLLVELIKSDRHCPRDRWRKKSPILYPRSPFSET